MTTKVKLKNVRLAFPDLFKAVEFKPGDGKPRFNATFLIEPGSDNDKAVWAAINAELKEAYGAKAAAQLEAMKGNSNKFCYQNGDLKDYDGFEGNFFLAAHSKVKPGVFDNVADPDTGKPAVVTADSGRVYAGCYVNATAEIYVQKGENPGVRGGFTGVQFAKDGDAFSAGRPASADEFDVSEGADDDLV